MDSDGDTIKERGGVTLAGGFNAAMLERVIGPFSLLVCKVYVHSN